MAGGGELTHQQVDRLECRIFVLENFIRLMLDQVVGRFPHESLSKQNIRVDFVMLQEQWRKLNDDV